MEFSFFGSFEGWREIGWFILPRLFFWSIWCFSFLVYNCFDLLFRNSSSSLAKSFKSSICKLFELKFGSVCYKFNYSLPFFIEIFSLSYSSSLLLLLSYLSFLWYWSFRDKWLRFFWNFKISSLLPLAKRILFQSWIYFYTSF